MLLFSVQLHLKEAKITSNMSLILVIQYVDDRQKWWQKTHLIVTKAASSRKCDVADIWGTRGRCGLVQQQTLCLATCLPTKTVRFTGGVIYLTCLLLLPEVMQNGHHIYCKHTDVTKIRSLIHICDIVGALINAKETGFPGLYLNVTPLKKKGFPLTSHSVLCIAVNVNIQARYMKTMYQHSHRVFIKVELARKRA